MQYVSVAGVPTVGRLSEMLDAATFAFIAMTAEDAQRDGTVNARLNVVHDVVPFQGRLGFERAIVLREDGCEEFSNITGLGQIRFPAGLPETWPPSSKRCAWSWSARVS